VLLRSWGDGGDRLERRWWRAWVREELRASEARMRAAAALEE
jgi:hypothetical protein